MNNLHTIKEIELGMTGRCNAGCIDCERWKIINQKEIYVNGNNPALNKILDVDVLLDVCAQTKNLRFILMSGVSGDALAHPRLAEFCEKVIAMYPAITIEITTNGSLGNQSTWKLLAEMNANVQVIFSIDGLEDTNHIYRRNVMWKNIMRNVEIFNSAQGHSKWKWVEFPWNLHQIEQAKSISKQLGFKKFYTVPRYSPQDWFDQLILDNADKPIPITSDDTPLVPKHSQKHYKKFYKDLYQDFINANGKILPECSIDPRTDQITGQLFKIYIEADGSVWPCCFSPTQPFYKQSYARLEWLEFMQTLTNKYGKDWNYLGNKPISEIVSTELFAPQLIENFDSNNPEKILPMCMINCGVCDTSTIRGSDSEHQGFFSHRNYED